MISIRWRLTILLCLSVGALFVATGFGVFLSMRQLLRSQFDETLTAKARALITASEIDDGDFEIDLTVQDFAGFGPHGGDDFFEIRRADGGTFLRSPSLESAGSLGKIKVPPYPRAVISDGRLQDGRPARFYVQRFIPKDDKKERFQDLHLIVASPTRQLQMQLALLATVLGIAGAAALLLMVPVIRLGLGRGLRPLEHLSREIHGIRPERLDQRLGTSGLPAELVPVATGLNEWLGRLQASFDRERRFSSNAAHELRTPLAELKSMAELGSMFPEEATPERCTEMLAVAGELEALLEKLALLARADAGRQPVSFETVDPEAAVESATERLAAKAAGRRVGFRTEVERKTFTTDPVLWNTIVQNLVGNAVSHAPEDSEVVVRTGPGRITVSNPAPGLRREDLDHLFERFWRKDGSRSGYDHSGLGLSIVQACTRILGGSCHADLDSNGMFRVEVTLPESASPTNVGA